MINTSALRRIVIDKAVAGKLVSDTTLNNAEDELKNRLLQHNLPNKNKVNKEGLWENIPSNWTWTNLDNLTDSDSLNDGDWVLKKDMSEDGEVKLIQLGSIGNCFFKDKAHKLLTLEHFNELNGKQIYPGYMLINRLVTDRMNACIIPKISGVLMTAVDVCWVKPVDDLYNIEYLMYALSSTGVQNMVSQLGHGVTRFRISKTNLIKIPIPFPPLELQGEIVNRIKEVYSILDKIDYLQSQYNSDVDVLKNKIIYAGIQGKLTEQLPTDGSAENLYNQLRAEKKEILNNRNGRIDKKIKEVEDDVPYAIPNNWKWIRFGEVGLFKKGPFGSALTKSMFVPKSEDTIKVYEQQHAIHKDSTLGTYYITKEYFEDKMSGFEVCPGDILVSCAGTIGETYILPDEIEKGIINQALMRVTLAPSINKRFFQLYFDANLKKAAQEESNGSAIKNIPPFDVMKNWYFPLPPLSEQERIVEKTDSLLSIIEMHG